MKMMKLLIVLGLLGIQARCFEVHTVVESFTDLGEGPHWCERQQVLYLVDIHDKKLLQVNETVPSGPPIVRKASVDVEGPVTMVVPVQDAPGLFMATVGRSFVLVDWNVEVGETDSVVLAEIDQAHPENRFNDGKCDPNGVIFAGKDLVIQ